MMPTADGVVRASKLPLYHQLYEILREKVRRAEWRPGEMIPSESELLKRYGVSRVTARQALDALVRDGLIYRERGRGSFVARPALEKGIMRILSFTEDMLQRGLTPGTRVLCAGVIRAPFEIAEKLSVEAGEELVRLERLRLAENEPLSIEESHLIHRYCPGILKHDFAQESLCEVLERDYGIRWSRATQVIRAVVAAPREAEILSIRPRSSLLFLERISYSQQSTPLEFLRIQYRGDRYALYNELTG